jgi:ethanolamine ammonia-lyase large subunit
MAVAGNADPMLGYLTTSFREHPTLRRQSGTTLVPAMRERLEQIDAIGGAPAVARVAGLYARFARAGGDTRTVAVLEDDARRTIASLRERGFDIAGDESAAVARVDRIYEHARRALYATLEESVLRDACGVYVRVRSAAVDREDYLAHPPAGERLRDDDIGTVLKSASRGPGGIQIVVSDGLNANSINEQLRALLPSLRRRLAAEGHAIAETLVAVQNGRVRAGYHVAQLLEPEALIHIIGERPGTGLNSASVYVTYGRDAAGQLRWEPGLDHSCTTAVCGIHMRGKPPEAAAAEIARTVQRMFEQRRSGVALR